MFGLFKESVRHDLDEIFRLAANIKDETDHEVKERRASVIWFEIFGMQRAILSIEKQFLIMEMPCSKDEFKHEFKEIKKMIGEALKQADALFESVQK